MNNSSTTTHRWGKIKAQREAEVAEALARLVEKAPAGGEFTHVDTSLVRKNRNGNAAFVIRNLTADEQFIVTIENVTEAITR